MNSSRGLMLAIVAFAFLAAPVLGQAAPSELDVVFANVSCALSNGTLLSAAAIAPLWNPAQEEDPTSRMLVGHGPEWIYNWSGSGTGTVICSWSANATQRFRAVEVETKTAASIASIKLDGVDQLTATQRLTPFMKFRVEFDDRLSSSLEIAFSVPCPNGKCSINLAELSIFPITLEPTQVVSQDGVPRDAVFPGETVHIDGTAGSKLYTCDGIRNLCAWAQAAPCVGNIFDKDCRFWGCLQKNWYGGIEVISTQTSDSGRCAGFFEKWGLKILGIIMILVSWFCPAACTTIGIFLLGAFGSALMVYNPDLPIGDQWLSLGLAFIAGGLSSVSMNHAIAQFTSSLRAGAGGTITQAQANVAQAAGAIPAGSASSVAAGTAVTAVMTAARHFFLNQAFASLASLILKQFVQKMVTKLIKPLIVKIINFGGRFESLIENFLSSFTASLVTPLIVGGVTRIAGEAIEHTVSENFGHQLETISAVELTQFSSEYIWKTIEKAAITSLYGTLKTAVVNAICDELGTAVEKAYCNVIGSYLGDRLQGLVIDMLNLSIAPTRIMEIVRRQNDAGRVALADGGLDHGIDFFDPLSRTTLNAINADASLRNAVLTDTLTPQQEMDISLTPAGARLLESDTTIRREILGNTLLGVGTDDTNILEHTFTARSPPSPLEDPEGFHIWQGEEGEAYEDQMVVLAQTQTWEVMDGAEKLLAEIQRTNQMLKDFGKGQDEIMTNRERFVNSLSCACYGELWAGPQYLLEANAPNCSVAATRLLSMGAAVYMAGYQGYGNIDTGRWVNSLAFPGRSWCVSDLSSWLANAWPGKAVSVAIKNETAISREHHLTTSSTGTWAINTLAPDAPGTYIVEARTAGNATSSLVATVLRATLLWSQLPDNPLNIRAAINTAQSLIDGLAEAPHLSAVRDTITDLKGFLEVLAAVPIAAEPAEIGAAKDALDSVLSAAESVAATANASGHATELAGPNLTIDMLKDGRDAVAGLLPSRNLNSIISAIEMAAGARDALYDILTKPEMDESRLRGLPTGIADGYEAPTEIEWRNYTPYVISRMIFGGHTVWGLTPSSNIARETIVPSNLSAILNITWASTHWYDVPTAGAGGVIGLDFSKLSEDVARSRAAIAALDDATNSTIGTIGYNDALPGGFLSAVASVRQLSQNMGNRIGRIKPVLIAMTGKAISRTDNIEAGRITRCAEWKPVRRPWLWGWGGYLSECWDGDSPTIGADADWSYGYGAGDSIVCPPCPEDYCCWNESVSVNVDHHALSAAAEAMSFWLRLQLTLNQSIDIATDAVYTAQLRALPEPKIPDVIKNLDDMEAALTNVSAEPIIARRSELERKINATDIEKLAAITAGGIVEGVSSARLEVISPELDVYAERETLCGSGEPLRYPVSISADAAWPVIPVAAGWWTPFSVPYVPRTNVTLGDIAHACDVQALAWWNSSAQQAVAEANVSGAALVPGRGYYLRSGNNCTISFAASDFDPRPDARINLTAAGNLVAGKLFIGAASHSMPYDTDSLIHKVYNAWEIYPEQFNRNCSQLGYELYYKEDGKGGVKIDKPAGNWSWLLEARPTQAEPFAGVAAGGTPAGELADMIRPGRTYWVWSNHTCSLNGQLPGALQTTGLMGPKPVTFNVTLGLPSGWAGGVISDPWLTDTDEFCWGTSNPTMCASVGSTGVLREVEIRPSTGTLGDYPIGVDVANAGYGANASIGLRYMLVSAVPELRADATKVPARIDYALRVVNTAPDFCQARTHVLQTEGPLGWNLNQSAESFELLPGDAGTANVALLPVPGAADGGWFNAFAISERSERAEAQASGSIAVCLPAATARDVASNGARLFYSSTDGIHAFDADCNDVLLAAGGMPYGIDWAGENIFWVDGASHKIRSYDLASGAISDIADVGMDAWYVAADAEAVYWSEGDTIRRAANGTVATIADGLDAPAGLDADEQFVYWAEPARIRKVAKAGNCSGDGCAVVANISAALLGPAPGRLQDVAAGEALFAAVSNVQFEAERDYSKILRINANSVDVVTKTAGLELLGAAELSGLAAGGGRVYWAAGGVDRISGLATAAVYSDLIIVPGHNPAVVDVEPVLLEHIAGVPLLFNVTVTSTNSADAPESVSKFWIKSAQLQPGLELCHSEFECESANEFGATFSRRDLLEEYANDYRWIKRGDSVTFEFWVRPKGDMPEGTLLSFNVTAGSSDPATEGSAGGTVNITKPRAPQVQVVPQEPWLCFSGLEQLPPGFVSPSCEAHYSIDITNPEARTASYRVGVTAPAYWNTELTQETVDVPGLLSFGEGWNQRSVLLDITPVLLPPFGAWQFAVNVSNVEFPERSSTALFNLTVTPDNMNDLCEPELGETPENTPDCRSAFVCGFGDKCENTTPSGVDWSASLATGEAMTAFGVCALRPGQSRVIQEAACFDELGRAEQPDMLCSAGTGACHRNCAERSGQYFLVARTASANYSSPAFHYGCPACIGQFFSPIVKADLNLHRWRPELESGWLSFGDWLTIIGEAEFLYAMNWQPSRQCIDATRGIVDRGVALNRSATDVLAGLSGPVDGRCAATRTQLADFINNSERTIEEFCRYAGGAVLNITQLLIPNVTLGLPTNATIEILNPGQAANAQARCTFERPVGGRFAHRTSISSCAPLGAGESANFSVPLDAGLGNWSAMCEALWSMFSDCAVTVAVDARSGNLTVAPPNTSLHIANWDVPHYGVQGEEIIIRIDVNNSGEAANASVACELLDANDETHMFESDTKLIGFNQTVPFRISVRPNIPGDWVVDSCSVYKIGSKILHQLLQIGASLVVWPACTSACRERGWDFGGCFSNATPVIGSAGDYGCGATERCTCGILNITERTCSRVGATGGVGQYNATIRGRWQTGTYLRFDGSFIQTEQFEWRQQRQSGLYIVNATVYKAGTPIWFTPLELNCIAPPLVEITEPADGAVVRGTAMIRARVVDANASLEIDGVPAGIIPAAGYVWDTASVSDGWHALQLGACNAAGCAEAKRNVRVQNEVVLPLYDFVLDPGLVQSSVRAGETATATFVITNSGTGRDSYALRDEMNTTWPRVVSINGTRFARTIALDAGESAIFEVDISVPSGAMLGDSAGLTVTATSAVGRASRASGPHAITVAEIPKSPPELLAAWHDPVIAHRGEQLTFYARLAERDNGTITDVRVCKDSNCGNVWCSVAAGVPTGIFNCSITAPLAGNYSYWLVARDTENLITVSGKRTFYVSLMPAGPVSQNNIAANSTANASSEVAGQAASRAVDGDPSTYWVSDSPLPQWLQVDLQQPRWVGGVGIQSASPARPRSFDVLVGDCTNFQTAYSEQNARYSTDNWYRAAFDAILGRCVRINVSSTEKGMPYAVIAELEVYEGQPPSGAPPMCGNGACEAGETQTCPTDCQPAGAQPTPGLPIWVWIMIAGAIVGLALLMLPRIRLWLEYYRE